MKIGYHRYVWLWVSGSGEEPVGGILGASLESQPLAPEPLLVCIADGIRVPTEAVNGVVLQNEGQARFVRAL